MYRFIRNKGHKNYSCSSKAANSLWFDVRVNEICVKFRFTGSGFRAQNRQNEFSRILTKEHVIWETNYGMFHYSLRVIDDRAKNERN